jgi:hypothetical protein
MVAHGIPFSVTLSKKQRFAGKCGALPRIFGMLSTQIEFERGTEMRQQLYRIGYDRIGRRELLARLGLSNCVLVEHKWLQQSDDVQREDISPDQERHAILVRYQHRPSEWITFTGLYDMISREPIPWIDAPIEYHLYGDELYLGNFRREKAPHARIPAHTKLQIASIRGETVTVTVPGHPSRRYRLSLGQARFAKAYPTELELKLQVFSFPPHGSILVDWLLEEGRKQGVVTLPNGDRVMRSAFQVWDELRQEYGISANAALLAIKQALVTLDRAGVENEFPYPIDGNPDLSSSTEEERNAFYSYHAVRTAFAAVSALLTTDPKDPLQDHLLMEIMLEQQLQRRRDF